METPKNTRQSRPVRNPTPRLSERKKSLFSKDARKEDIGDDFLEGIELLDSTRDDMVVDDSSSSTRKHGIDTILGADGRSHMISFFNDETEKDERHERTSTRRSLRVMLPKMSVASIGTVKGGKENSPRKARVEEGPEEQLQKLFSSSMRLGAPRHKAHAADGHIPVLDSPESLEKEDITVKSVAGAHKRHAERSLPGSSPHKKIAKLVGSPHSLSISTKTFYSAPKASPTTSPNSALYSAKNSRSATQPATSPSSSISPRTRVRQERREVRAANINKGVRHKIRRRSRPFGSGTCHLPSLDVDVILKNMRNDKLKKLIVSKREERIQIEKVHSIFRNSQNPIAMARPLSIISSTDDSNNNKSTNSKQLDPTGNETTNLQSKESNEEAYVDFSDIEYDCDEQDEGLREAFAKDEVIPLVRHQLSEVEAAVAGNEEGRSKTPINNRKFFKSGRTSHTPKEVKITDNIRASVHNGKISLVQEEKKIRKRPKAKQTVVNEFSDEQATVEAILKNLDDTAFGDLIETVDTEISHTKHNQYSESASQIINMEAEDLFLEQIQIHDNIDYSKFRERLPYNTTDPEIAEQQHLLLDFLISNNICTEENFMIFIADPDNNKEKAARIVDQVILVVNEHSDYRERLPYNTTDPELTAQQHRMLDFLIENDICTEENFDIFIANYERRRHEADIIMGTIQTQNRNTISMECTSDVRDNEVLSTEPKNTANVLSVSINSTGATSEKLFPIFYPERWKPLEQKSRRRLPRTWCGGEGAAQYQIDLGQRDFGAQQCKQCGLVYSVHEPEEEKLHREYHTSLHVLRFKGWIDEDIVAIYPEWGPDGRILRLTENSHLKRRERLAEILRIVDKELGFSSYVIPNIFVVYLAVRKHQFVGLCLVQPLDKANKYVCIDGVDCCSEEQFPAKCGISRIWVSPLHRRLRIASKLIQAVQQNTIFGEEIPLDQIAFSAPTESGKLFAQKITQRENFLVYQ